MRHLSLSQVIATGNFYQPEKSETDNTAIHCLKNYEQSFFGRKRDYTLQERHEVAVHSTGYNGMIAEDGMTFISRVTD